MESESVFLGSEFVAALLSVVLGLSLGGIFIYAYMRCRRFFFILLCIAALCSAFANSYAALLIYSALTHAAVFATPIGHFLTRAYVILGPAANLIGFVGTVLLVRFALRLHRGEKT